MTSHRPHLRRMRAAGFGFLATLPVLQIAAVLAPRKPAGLPPATITLLAAAGALWVAFTAERDARGRLDRIKRAFAVHGSESRLLTDHLRVYLAVLLRLEAIAGFGVVVAVWGLGPKATPWFLVLAAVLMGLTWPTEAKTRLLIDRGQALRPPEQPARPSPAR